MDTRYRSVAGLANLSLQISRIAGGAPSVRGLAALIILLAGASGGFAQNWAEKMFDHTSHDFRVVATGAKVEHRFPFTNIWEEDVLVLSTKSSCGCSSVKATKQTIKTYETAEIVVGLDTRNFSQQKDATITVEFQFEKLTAEGNRVRSRKVEARLQTYAYIRQDVVLTPGSAQFSSIREGTASQKEINLKYAGADTWRITAIECQNPHLVAKATEIRRDHGLVEYLVQVDLKGDAPAGYIREHIALVTNDDNPNAKRVLIAVEGIVEPAVSVNPSPLSFGVVQPGKPVTKNIVVTADDPFKVVAVTSPDDRFQFVVSPKAAKTQVVRAVFTPDEEFGPFAGKMTIQTDIPNHETLDLTFNGRVGSAGQGTSKKAPPESASAEESGKKDAQPPAPAAP